MAESNKSPEQVKVLGIDALPYECAIWCSVGDSEPFANTIEHRSWSEDGEHIWFLLGTHNTYKAKPYELISVVRKVPAWLPRDPLQSNNEAFVATRPGKKPDQCARCKGTGVEP